MPRDFQSFVFTCLITAVCYSLLACNDRQPPLVNVVAAKTDSVVDCEPPSRFSAAANLTKVEGKMTYIMGGEFLMGTDDDQAYEAERPAHTVKVSGFWMDLTEVTNLQFKEFVEATGYITVAERKPDWDELKKQLPPNTPKPDESQFIPASLVFTPPSSPVDRSDYSNWWKWKPGANWKQPEGPGSNLEGRWNHPVVHIAWEDANAYAKWAGKRLPTEAEWEFAARGGLTQNRFAWGREFRPANHIMANTYQGEFPHHNLVEDGFERTAPVASFPANQYGLYDMIGNVWEWTSDWYDANYYKKAKQQIITGNPTGPEKSYDPEEPYSMKRVTKGGSFLCADDYCINYRPSARRGTAYDSGASHIGFRCVSDKAPSDHKKTASGKRPTNANRS